MYAGTRNGAHVAVGAVEARRGRVVAVKGMPPHAKVAHASARLCVEYVEVGCEGGTRYE